MQGGQNSIQRNQTVGFGQVTIDPVGSKHPDIAGRIREHATRQKEILETAFAEIADPEAGICYRIKFRNAGKKGKDPQIILFILHHGKQVIGIQALAVEGIVMITVKTLAVIFLQTIIRRKPHKAPAVLQYRSDIITRKTIICRNMTEKKGIELGLDEECITEDENKNQENNSPVKTNGIALRIHG